VARSHWLWLLARADWTRDAHRSYPAKSISIITSYNGQKALLKDVIDQRCTHNPLYGPPREIDTVDKFQGQQNDYVLLSMVRTRAVGHIRDVRRLVRRCSALRAAPCLP
jgi:intron-binding protein aquarius